MAGAVVAIVGWRRGARLAENRRLIERAAAAGSVRPRNWRDAPRRWRSVTVRVDGTVEFGTRTARAAARSAAAVTRRQGTRGKDRET